MSEGTETLSEKRAKHVYRIVKSHPNITLDDTAWIMRLRTKSLITRVLPLVEKIAAANGEHFARPIAINNYCMQISAVRPELAALVMYERFKNVNTRITNDNFGEQVDLLVKDEDPRVYTVAIKVKYSHLAWLELGDRTLEGMAELKNTMRDVHKERQAA